MTSTASSTPTVGQQWFVIPVTSVERGRQVGTVKLVNRYSGLALGLSGDRHRPAETTPVRSWTDRSHSQVGDSRTAAEQTLTLRPGRGR